MIITITKGIRTRGDAGKLVRHLFGKENDYVDVVEIGNSCAPNLNGLLADARIMRDGAAFPTSHAAFHISVSPGTRWSRAALLKATHLVRQEFDPDGGRAFAILVHGKRRAGGAQASSEHAHLILASVDESGRALKDKFSKIRCERLARTLEFNKGFLHGRPTEQPEPPTLGAHHVAVVRALRSSRLTSPVAERLVQTYGERPESPRSAYSNAARNLAKRKGIKLPKIRADVQRIWAEAGSFSAFMQALSARGYSIEKGHKHGVWVLRDRRSDFIVGAVDRLLKIKRQDVRSEMEIYNAGLTECRSGAGIRVPRRTQENEPAARSPHASAVSARTANPIRGRGPGYGNSTANRSTGDHRAAPQPDPCKHRHEAQCAYRQLRNRSALRIVRRLGGLLLKSPVYDEALLHARQLEQSMWTPEMVDLWGKPIEPPKYYVP